MTPPSRRGRLASGAIAAALLPVSLLATNAQATVQAPGLVSAVPAAFTPSILTPTTGNPVFGSTMTVRVISQVGSQVVVGGNFTDGVEQAGSKTSLKLNDIFAMNATTGVINTGFAPKLNGAVLALAAGPVVAGDPTVYVGGQFTTVNGAKSKSLTLLDLTTGLAVPGFKVPAFNGVVNTLAVDGSMLLIGGTFTVANSTAAGGIVALSAATGTYLPYITFGVTTNHNWTPTCTTCAEAAVGVTSISVAPNGTRMVMIGNFKTAGGLARDQVALVDLGSTSATVDPNWATQRYTAACSSSSYDSYVRSVAFSPDGSYFVITTTGGGGKSLPGSENCDSAARFDTNTTGTTVQPTWSDYAGNDSLYGLAITQSAVYVGGHFRWLNNPNGTDSAGGGSVARPTLAALNPLNGLPYSWNPGRNPRGADTYAVYATTSGLWIGYNTNYIGNYQYKRPEIAFFPYTGGETLPSDLASQLPANVYVAGPRPEGSGKPGANSLLTRSYNGATVGATTSVTGAPVDWADVRGAFMANGTLFYGYTDGQLHSVTFNGTTWGTPALVQPFVQPAWDTVQTGSGQTYQGAASPFYGEITKVTGLFYSSGYIYYTLSGKSGLYYRYFEPEDGLVGGTEFTAKTSVSLKGAEGLFASGGTIYWAQGSTGDLLSAAFTGALAGQVAAVTGSSTVADSANDWNGYATFIG